jgi:hypothetical protein
MGSKKKYEKKDEAVKEIERLIKRDRNFACSALLTLYNYQTDDEKESNMTVHKNHIGFSVTDAIELSAIACAVERTRTIDEGTYDDLKRMLPRYAKQVLHATLSGELKEFSRDKAADKKEFYKVKFEEYQRLQREAQRKRNEKKIPREDGNSEAVGWRSWRGKCDKN